MPSYVFLCNLNTEQECLDRRLFGTTPGPMHRDYYSKIAVGDALFLYNFETGAFRGPFTAITTCQKNIEPSAWKKGKQFFPWQTRIDDTASFKIPINADDLSKIIRLSATTLGMMPPTELTSEETATLLDALKKKNFPQ